MAPSNSNLNGATRLLKHITEFNGEVKHFFTRDINSSAPVNDPDAVGAGYLGDLLSQLDRLPDDLQTVHQLIETKFNGDLVDDRTYLIEDLIRGVASLPSDSRILPKVTEVMIKKLWNGLSHPPQTYLGDKWVFRTADGSNNNRSCPHLGAGGSPYARTVPPRSRLTPNSQNSGDLPSNLPDPGLIFDEIFARGDEAKQHPNRISSFLFHFAAIIIHDCFRTNDRNYDVVDSSSYLDLGPLYGNNEAAQKQVRTFRDGKLKNDVFAEVRILGFPPGVGAILVCFNRFHNYVVGELKTINEGGRFTLAKSETVAQDEENKKVLDEKLFQTGRLITCGLYVNIVLFDYVRTILNLNRCDSTWTLDPRADLNTPGPSSIPQGTGNQVSVEFNLLYRWHSATSTKDEHWTEDFFRDYLHGQDPATISPEDLGKVFRQFIVTQSNIPVNKWVFGKMTRDKKTGAFKDADLANILADSTDDVAGAFGARNVPVCMRAIEILGMEQARKWNVATLNEFRNYFGLKPYDSFDEITSDKDLAESLKTLYGSTDMVELYPGLIAEDTKEPQVPGSGLCPGFTTATAILSDATALVRGDRFYTSDWNAATYTNWGFTQIAANPVVAGGGVIYKLLMNALPNWYKGNSIYAMFPFTTPPAQREVLTKLGQIDDYDFNRPSHTPDPIIITSYKAVVNLLHDWKHFRVPWGPNTEYITGCPYMLDGDGPNNSEQRVFVNNALKSPSDPDMDSIKDVYYDITSKLLKESSRKLRQGYMVDIVADIGNLSHAYAAGAIWHIPLKSIEHPTGPMTAFEFYTAYALLFSWVFLDLQPASEFQLRYYAKLSADKIKVVVRLLVESVRYGGNIMERFMGLLKEKLGVATSGRYHQNESINNTYGVKLIQRLSEGGKSVEEVTETIIPTMAAMIATQAQGFAQMIDLYLTEPYRSKYWPKIEELARSDNPENFETLRRYALEGYRLATPAFGVLRNSAVNGYVVKDTPDPKTPDQPTIKTINKGDRVFADFVHAGLDPLKFGPNPRDINLKHPKESYIHHGTGPHTCLGRDIANIAMASQLRACGRLINLRRVDGPQGTMQHKLVNNAFKVYLKADGSDYWPLPTTMKVRFDDFYDEDEIKGPSRIATGLSTTEHSQVKERNGVNGHTHMNGEDLTPPHNQTNGQTELQASAGQQEGKRSFAAAMNEDESEDDDDVNANGHAMVNGHTAHSPVKEKRARFARQ